MITYDINLKYDFGKIEDGFNWAIINDDVMGGISNSNIVLTDNSVIFKGNTSLKNNGGFASIRSPLKQIDLSQFKSVKIKFRSDSDREFALRLGLYEVYYKPNYKYFFKPSIQGWETIEFNLSDFKEYTLGKLTNDTISMRLLDKVLRIAVIVADKKEGPFEIEIDYIEFY